MQDGERSARQYDAMASAYAADNDEGPFNAYYERPATIDLLGTVTGQHVLEVGCGAGPLTAWLVKQGAVVTAMDVSPEMIRLARARVADRATLYVADLNDGLRFSADHSYDVVVASLVLHYVEEWERVLVSLRRVLRERGVVVFSTHHPTLDWELHSREDYFAVKQVTETWHKGSRPFEVTFWRRPLTAMAEAIAAAGFVIERLVEPQPLPEMRDRHPDVYEKLRTRPWFLFFRIVVA